MHHNVLTGVMAVLLLAGCAAQPEPSPQGRLEPCVVDQVDAPGWICMPGSISKAAVGTATYGIRPTQQQVALKRACEALNASVCRALRYWHHPKTRTLYVLAIRKHRDLNVTVQSEQEWKK